MTREEKCRVISYLDSAGYEIGNLDSGEEWGWDGCDLAKMLSAVWGIDKDRATRRCYPEIMFSDKKWRDSSNTPS